MRGWRITSSKELIEEVEIQNNRYGMLNVPAWTVLTEPPAKKEGFALVWDDNEGWSYKEDHRGTKYWLSEDKYGTEGREMKELGPLPEGATLTAPPEPTKEEKWQEFLSSNYANLTAEELRNRLYQTQRVKFVDDDITQGESEIPLCFLDGKNMTVDEAKSRWLNYYGDDDTKAQEALTSSLQAKEYIRTVVANYKEEN